MLYKIKNDLFVRVGNKYVKVIPKMINGEVGLEPTDEKIEMSNNLNVVEYDFKSHQEELKRSLNKIYDER